MSDETVEPSILINWYEQLRAYVVSPCKTLSTPLGFNLWIKKGFKGWMSVLVSYKNDCKNKKIIPELGQTHNLHNSSVPAESRKELALLITNMILSRRVK
jgi:hypothetical protein